MCGHAGAQLRSQALPRDCQMGPGSSLKKQPCCFSVLQGWTGLSETPALQPTSPTRFLWDFLAVLTHQSVPKHRRDCSRARRQSYQVRARMPRPWHGLLSFFRSFALFPTIFTPFNPQGKHWVERTEPGNLYEPPVLSPTATLTFQMALCPHPLSQKLGAWFL